MVLLFCQGSGVGPKPIGPTSVPMGSITIGFNQILIKGSRDLANIFKTNLIYFWILNPITLKSDIQFSSPLSRSFSIPPQLRLLSLFPKPGWLFPLTRKTPTFVLKFAPAAKNDGIVTNKKYIVSAGAQEKKFQNYKSESIIFFFFFLWMRCLSICSDI